MYKNVILKIIKEKKNNMIDDLERTVVLSCSSNDFNEGDIVLIPRHTGTRFKYLDDELINIDERDIILCVKEVG